ncbi:MAG: DUF6446 family protein [Qingshengfaniella sp.]
MKGKHVGIGILAIAALAGGGIYYLQEYHYYDRVDAAAVTIRLTPVHGGRPQAIPVSGLQAIDAGSSPIRFRACFTTSLSTAMLTETYQLYDAAEPLTAPRWFDCFDAAEIGAALETGEAVAFLSEANVAPGVDRIVAAFDDGRAYAWTQITPESAD